VGASSARFVVCGAGIAGVSAAYHLAVRHGAENVVLVEAGAPLSLTSDKSTEAYRNWWPGPDPAMCAFMNRSIDLLEEIAQSTGNRIHLNRRGYLFASAESEKVNWLHDMAKLAEAQGAGSVRVHDAPGDAYVPLSDHGFDRALTGVDLITSESLIRRRFPYLNPGTRVVGHARRAGWLSAQQLGMVMLEAARERGVRLVTGSLIDIATESGRVRGVRLEEAGWVQTLEATHVILAVGPKLKQLAERVGLDLPVFAERHLKISLKDALGVVPRDAPMLIWLDSQLLPWSADERALLAADAATRWLTEPFPAGVHGRPDGSGSSTTLLVLFNYDNRPAEIVLPVPLDEHYGEIALRGFSTMVPALQAYFDKGARPYIDGGYYTKTPENRPLIGPTSIEGLFISGAYSGFGIMAACASGELIARHVLGAELPSYAASFSPARFEDAAYLRRFKDWGDGAQL
jgi:glycine/D-amino acid oxidase-like deaminating enzyme